MFCKYCGNELSAGSNFCSRCGKMVDEPAREMEHPHTEAGEDLFAAPVEQPVGRSAGTSDGSFDDGMFVYAEEDQQDEAERDELGGSILKFGIMSLAFGASGWLSILGLIFACIAKSRVRTYIEKFKETQGRATAGRILSTIGLIVSIVETALMALVFFFIILAILILSMEDGSVAESVAAFLS